MANLIAACLFFLAMHWLVSGSPLRTPIVKLFGEKLFKAFFSISIFIALSWMVYAFLAAPYLSTWGTADNLKPITLGLMFLVCLMLPLSVFDKNPTTLGIFPPDQVSARGIVRITRHAGLIALGLWGLAHFIVNGDWASHWLYGTIAFEGLIGPLNLDRKYRARHGEAWLKFTQQTSYLPFAAIISGRNKLVLTELNPWGFIAGLSLFATLIYFHKAWFGVSALAW
tara:strand:- start:138 stop:815 length:678 start_codon:yes stop_codon:yes gene_type:complete